MLHRTVPLSFQPSTLNGRRGYAVAYARRSDLPGGSGWSLDSRLWWVGGGEVRAPVLRAQGGHVYPARGDGQHQMGDPLGPLQRRAHGDDAAHGLRHQHHTFDLEVIEQLAEVLDEGLAAGTIGHLTGLPKTSMIEGNAAIPGLPGESEKFYTVGSLSTPICSSDWQDYRSTAIEKVRSHTSLERVLDRWQHPFYI